MIQDIFPKKLNNSYRNITPENGDNLMFFEDGKLLLWFNEESSEIVFPHYEKKLFYAENGQEPEHKFIYLFSIDEEKYFLHYSNTNDKDRVDKKNILNNLFAYSSKIIAGSNTDSSYQQPVIKNGSSSEKDKSENSRLKEGFGFYTLREIRAFNTTTKDRVYAAYTAFHLWRWYEDNRFCGRCGTTLLPDGWNDKSDNYTIQPEKEKTENRTEETEKAPEKSSVFVPGKNNDSLECKNTEIKTVSAFERALVCPNCKNKIYPRINPAVIVALTNGDRIVITRYRRGYANNALIAGFAEIGETLEETVAREVMEEVGLKVKNIRYYKSQPWGMAQDMLTGFFCELDGDDHIKMDEGELKYAEWVKREDVVLQPSDYSLTNEMMKLFRDGRSFS